MSIELKIKAISLADEARTIRRFERAQRRLGNLEKYVSLRSHRINEVRQEARATHLARAYIAGKTYKSVEQKVKKGKELSSHDHTRIKNMVWKYGGYAPDLKDKIKAWLSSDDALESAA